MKLTNLTLHNNKCSYTIHDYKSIIKHRAYWCTVKPSEVHLYPIEQACQTQNTVRAACWVSIVKKLSSGRSLKIYNDIMYFKTHFISKSLKHKEKLYLF